ncbi:MAG TPA: hypothetical protein VLD63_02125 [Anaerolineales bacterium]|nr:hypothetical protein [Anaerolineales bacterium]
MTSSSTTRPAPFDTLRLTAALSMLGAGLMHLMILPEHFDHAPAHAWFFAVVGILQLGWSAIAWRPTRKAVDVFGLAMAGCLILLWVVTRIYPAPFSAGPEEVDGSGLISKALEAASFVTLAIVLVRQSERRWLAGGTLLAVVATAGLYFGGRIAGPAFPSLWADETASEAGVHSHVLGQRVRLDDAATGPWLLRVLTSPVPPTPDNFLVEVRVKDARTGRVRRDVTVWVEARPEQQDGVPIRVEGSLDGAKIPGEYAAPLSVEGAGVWLITVNVAGPDGNGQVGFAERVASPLGLGAWMSALLPFAGLALLVLGYAALARTFPSDS